MNFELKNDLAALPEILEEVKKLSIDFLSRLDNVPTSVKGLKIVSSTLPDSGYGAKNALEIFSEHYSNLMVSAAGPRYWGYVVGGVTPAALAGDWLTSTFDQNTQSLKGSGDVSAMLEIETIRLMLQLFDLPESFNGGFVTGATMSNFTSLAVGRQWAGNKSGRDIARAGMSGEIFVMAATPHSSVIKSLSMLGFGSSNLVKIKTLDGREAVDVTDLESKLIEHSGRSVIVTCNAGTVNTVDFDNLAEIVRLKEKYNFWLHVDAAFGGFAACSPKHKYLLSGWELADSITIDCHKWMNVPYDSAIFLIAKIHEKLQIETFQNSNAPYLGDPSENFSYLNFLPENSRRFRALPAWFSLIAYGKNGYQWIVENSISCARSLAGYIESSSQFELAAPVRLNVVCFTLKNEPGRNQEFLNMLNERGKVFMTPSSLNGKTCIRAAFVNFRTSEKDIYIAIEEIEAVLKVL
jgi:glutamate/tyrosine decarboxylase-like PLP-dependent enzyme